MLSLDAACICSALEAGLSCSVFSSSACLMIFDCGQCAGSTSHHLASLLTHNCCGNVVFYTVHHQCCILDPDDESWQADGCIQPSVLCVLHVHRAG